MSFKPLVVRTKLTPLRAHRRVLQRERITQRLLESMDYRLTVVQAGAGYGKSTALSALSAQPAPLVWYRLEAEDADPLVFLMHLVSAFQPAFAGLGDGILADLEHWEADHNSGNWLPVIDMLINELAARLNEPTLLVMDDAHRLNDAPEPLRLFDRLCAAAPPDLHILAATRYPLRLPGLVNLKVRNELLHIDHEELAFTRSETNDLFCNQYGYQLSSQELDEVYASTEGWIIALQLYWQGLKSGALKPGQEGLQSGVPAEDLFAYLAQEVLARHPEEMQAFMRRVAVLRELSPGLCDDLLGGNGSRASLNYIRENNLSIIEMDDEHVRFHPLFRKFLLSQMSEAERQEMHTRAGECCLKAGQLGEAVDHFISASLPHRAAEILDEQGAELIREGRLDALQKWIGALPPAVLSAHPLLMSRLGDVGRLQSRFTEALAWYKQAEERSRQIGFVHGVSQALSGQARVYLDTVNPSQAEAVLEQMLRLTDGHEDRKSQARLLELMAENRLNLGRPDEAERYQQQAQMIREAGPSESELAVRVRLRTGRFAEARRMLEDRLSVEQKSSDLGPPRSHRETSLLLSLILSFEGDGEQALRYARFGAERGQQLHAPFITAVGLMREGHARLIQGDSDSYSDACRCYEETIQLSKVLSVPRLQVEALWGLCRARGLGGELAAAEESALQGVDHAEQAGDEWIKGLICVSMGAGLVEYHQTQKATAWLDRAESAFHGCSDSFGQAVTLLWQSVLWWNRGDLPRLDRSLRELFSAVREGGYDFLFLRRTLLGPSDPRSLVPLLIYGRDHEINRPEAVRLLKELRLDGIETHPGYQLRVQVLGNFRLWRGSEEVPASEWRREKARQLFQLFIANRTRLMDREVIADILWPELDPVAAQRDFKVALNALMRVLEPERSKEAPSAFISRDGRLYCLRASADLWLDSAVFEQWVEQGDRCYAMDPHASLAFYTKAVQQYRGGFFSEYLYEDGLAGERERLLGLYLRTADRLAHGLAEDGLWLDVIALCQEILQQDNCWEEAYRLQMLAYDSQGNRAQALRVYRRCVQMLQLELGADPGEAVQSLYDQIRGNDGG